MLTAVNGVQYIYLSESELAAVADLIRSRGRIDISQLSLEASKLLDLESREGTGGQGAPSLDMSLDQLVEE